MAAALDVGACVRGDGGPVPTEVLLPRNVRAFVRSRPRRPRAQHIIGDVVARTKRMRRCNVLHPFGWDAFGLPAENAAIKGGIHPEVSTRSNIAHMKGQLQRLGISYAWERELATCDPEYYKWNQWLFIRMFERGLAYRRRSSVNWCPSCNTVLANEQVVDGGCWRCGTPVEVRELEQWFFRITACAPTSCSIRRSL